MSIKMDEIGVSIRKKRIEKNLKIKDISKTLLISKRFIIAIEKTQVEKFSSKAYYDGYTKQYIKFLDLDLSNYNLSKQDTTQNLEIKIPEKDKLNPSLTFVFISIILMIILYSLCNNYINNTTL